MRDSTDQLTSDREPGGSHSARTLAAHTVLIFDSVELSRAGLHAVLDRESDIRVVGEVENSRDIASAARESRPDVVVLELDGFLRDSLRDLRAITAVAPVVALHPEWKQRCAMYALRGGVHGLVGKSDRRQLLLAAVRSAARRELFLTPSLTAQLVERVLNRAPVDNGMYDRIGSLTDRERDILKLLAAGRSTDEIAAEMRISGATVKSHVSHMLSKLGLRDRVQAVVLAFRMGLAEG